MKGEEALARAILTATDRRYTVPGYPITGLATLCNAEMVVNEKTGLEYALGDSLSGKRAALIVKNVGVNACVDPLVQATAQGLIGGVLLVAGDDPAAAGSQTSQDTRIIGELAEIPVLEPGPESCFSAVEAALEASEEFSRVAMLRVTPALLEAEATGDPVPRRDKKGSLSDRSYTMHGRVTASRRLFARMQEWALHSPLNTWQGGAAGIGPRPGETRVVTVFPPPSILGQYTEIREEGLPFAGDHCRHRFLPDPAEEEPETLESRGYYRTFCRDCPFGPVIALMKEEGLRPVCDAGCVYEPAIPCRRGKLRYGVFDRGGSTEHGIRTHGRLRTPPQRYQCPHRCIRKEDPPPLRRAGQPLCCNDGKAGFDTHRPVPGMGTTTLYRCIGDREAPRTLPDCAAAGSHCNQGGMPGGAGP